MAMSTRGTASLIRYLQLQGMLIALDGGQLVVTAVTPQVLQRNMPAINRHKQAMIVCLQAERQAREQQETEALASWCKPSCIHLRTTRLSDSERAMWCFQYKEERSWRQQRLCVMHGCPRAR